MNVFVCQPQKDSAVVPSAHQMHVYEGNSISKLQIQVATYVFEFSVGNCHRYIAALSSFIVMHNDRYAHDCTDVAAVTRWRRP
jgi:hypothetical protein